MPQLTPEFKQHLWDIFKGALGAAVTTFVLYALNQFGISTPDAARILGILGGGIVGVKIHA